MDVSTKNPDRNGKIWLIIQIFEKESIFSLHPANKQKIRYL